MTGTTPISAAEQTTLNMLTDHGCTLVLDTWGKDRITYRGDGVYLRFGDAINESPTAYTTCRDTHVVDAIRDHGVRRVIKG